MVPGAGYICKVIIANYPGPGGARVWRDERHSEREMMIIIIIMMIIIIIIKL